MTILKNAKELRIETNKLALGQFKVSFGNSKILNFILVPFKAQLYFILKKLIIFSFPVLSLSATPIALGKVRLKKKKKGKKTRLD